jgi:hypothetical protein
MTAPAIDIVDEKKGSASSIDALLAPSTPVEVSDPKIKAAPPPPAKLTTARLDATDGDLARVKELIARWKLPDLDTLRARALEGGRSLLEQAKGEARSVQASQSATAGAAKNAKPAATKATGKGFSAIRNVQAAQQMLAKQERELRELRAQLEAAKLANAARDARAEVLSTSEGIDELTAGFSALLGFLFDSVSEMRRMHYEQIAVRAHRPLDADELRAVTGWQLPDKRAEAIARPFAQYFSTRMGPEVVEMLPLLIGIGGLGGFILKGVQGERLAKAERTEMRRMGASS